jgi:hypothetical protein
MLIAQVVLGSRQSPFISLTLAIMIYATAVVIGLSKSLARRRLRLIQARVRSTTQRRGSTTVAGGR